MIDEEVTNRTHATSSLLAPLSVPTTAPGPLISLWSGAEPPATCPHAERGVLHGSFPHRTRRGKCVIWTRTPSLWIHVAHALGFSISSLRVQNQAFRSAVTSFFPELQVNSGHSSHSQLFPQGVSLAFLDFATVSSLCQAYWTLCRFPHVFTCQEEEVLSVPSGLEIDTTVFQALRPWRGYNGSVLAGDGAAFRAVAGGLSPTASASSAMDASGCDGQ